MFAGTAVGQLAVDEENQFAWSENLGWSIWHDAEDGDGGAMLHESVLSGSVWLENAGWLSLGDGDPADGVHYANVASDDYGVNVDPETGVLFGLAWGENIGWVNFDTEAALSASNQHARYDETAGRLRGYAWSENAGWINLDDDTFFVGFPLSAGDGDCDNDNDIDLVDFGVFQLCFSGSAPAATKCLCNDFDGDGDVDLVDFGQFQLAFTG
jgi:hypothetical protein